MEITSLPRYPTLEHRPTAGGPSRTSTARRDRVLSDLGMLVLIAAAAGGLRWTASGIERERARTAERLEQARDPAWVYGRLAGRFDFDELDAWCPLTPVPASPGEVARLEAAARAADWREALCSPVGRGIAEELGRVPLYEGLQWYRLQHPAVPDRWVGIAVKQYHFTGWSPRWIYCRVPVGFTPPTGRTPAAPDRGGDS